LTTIPKGQLAILSVKEGQSPGPVQVKGLDLHCITQWILNLVYSFRLRIFSEFAPYWPSQPRMKLLFKVYIVAAQVTQSVSHSFCDRAVALGMRLVISNMNQIKILYLITSAQQCLALTMKSLPRPNSFFSSVAKEDSPSIYSEC
jgi:hypothetical protein